MLRLKIDASRFMTEIISNVFQLLTCHFDFTFKIVEDNNADVIIGGENAHLHISRLFLSAIEKKNFDHNHLMQSDPLIVDECGKPDYLGTIIYMVHCLQEYIEPSCRDELFRFKYEHSYQYRFNCQRTNLVFEYMLKMVETLPAFKNVRKKIWRSKIWITHDVDYLLNGIWSDLKFALKHVQPRQIMQLIFQEFFRDRDKDLLDRIFRINEVSDIKSTFFWLVENNKVRTKQFGVIENGNYDFSSDRVQSYVRLIKKQGHTVGLHKSIGRNTYPSEAGKFFPHANSNRNHYLHGDIRDVWSGCHEAGIKIDSSLGFSGEFGFRNCYGGPFRPFDFRKKCSYDIIEVPLNIMDTSFMFLRKLPSHQCKLEILDFLDGNLNNCIISILWHYRSFSEIKYPDWIEVYKSLLEFIVGNDLDNIDVDQLNRSYRYLLKS